MGMSQTTKDEIRNRLDTKITALVNQLIAEEEAANPDALISVPRDVVVDEKRSPKSIAHHRGTTRPVTKAETETVAAASGRNGSGRRN